MSPFRECFPERHFEFGIMEQGVIGYASGLASTGKGTVMQDGSDVTIVSTGTVMANAYKAAQLLKQEGINARMIDLHTLKPVDKELIVESAEKTGKIVTVEEHYLAGGLGSIVAEILAKECPTPIKMIGVDDQFASNGPYEELLGCYNLLPDQIAAIVREFV